MRKNETAGGEEKTRKNYQQDGAYPDEEITRTISPHEYKIMEEGKKKSIKSREKVFVGKDSLDDFSGRIIKAISNPIRLKIILLLDEEYRKTVNQEITDEKGIYKLLKKKYNYRKAGIYQNHLKPMQDAGLIQRKTGIRDDEAVITYQIVPGAMELIITTLSNLSGAVKDALDESSHLTGDNPQLKILGGPQDRKIFQIKKNPTLLGREVQIEDNGPEDDIIITNDYRSVSRVYNYYDPDKAPHAKLILEEGDWYIEDCGNNLCGTYVNEEKIKKKKLKDYDIIGLARGKYSVDMLFRKPNKDISFKINYFGELEKTLTPEQQEELAGKINILLNKVTPEFFFKTLDNIIEQIKTLQEIETLIPQLKDGELKPTFEHKKQIYNDIIENLDKKEDIDLGDSLVNKYYSKMKDKRTND